MVQRKELKMPRFVKEMAAAAIKRKQEKQEALAKRKQFAKDNPTPKARKGNHVRLRNALQIAEATDFRLLPQAILDRWTIPQLEAIAAKVRESLTWMLDKRAGKPFDRPIIEHTPAPLHRCRRGNG
jgi:hypothetical protein